MALDHVDALDNHAVVFGKDLQDGAAAALVLAGQDNNAVALLNLGRH